MGCFVVVVCMQFVRSLTNFQLLEGDLYVIFLIKRGQAQVNFHRLSLLEYILFNRSCLVNQMRGKLVRIDYSSK